VDITASSAAITLRIEMASVTASEDLWSLFNFPLAPFGLAKISSGATNAAMLRGAIAIAIILAGADLAYAHGIAGNRYFVGTMTFDDPAVADEAIVPDYTYLSQPAQGSNVVENRIDCLSLVC
jgi:hypothetical protein